MNTSVNTVNAVNRASRTHKPKSNSHYIRDRFNDLKWIHNPITNHKVEQVLRAVCFPDLIFNHDVLIVHARNEQLITGQQDLDFVQVGTADEYGYRLAPETNSWLIRNGIKPNAFLLALGQVQVEGVPALLSRDGKLYMVFCALFMSAYEAVFAAKNLNTEYERYVKKHGIPKHFTVQDKFFDPKQLHEVV